VSGLRSMLSVLHRIPPVHTFVSRAQAIIDGWTRLLSLKSFPQEPPEGFCIYIQIISPPKNAPKKNNEMGKESPKIMREKEKKKKVDDFLFESLIVKGLILLLYGM
jgi:hypothetical protein